MKKSSLFILILSAAFLFSCNPLKLITNIFSSNESGSLTQNQQQPNIPNIQNPQGNNQGTIPSTPQIPNQGSGGAGMPNTPNGIPNPGNINIQDLLKGLGGNPPQGGNVAAIEWQKIMPALPQQIPGWQLSGNIEGGTNQFMGISASNVKGRFTQNNRIMEINIVDTSFSPFLASMLNIGRSVRINSTTQIQEPIDIQGQPGFISINTQTNDSKVLLVVNNRIMVTIEITGGLSNQQELNSIASSINFPLLIQLTPAQ